MITVTKKKTIKKTINKYISNDGQEFTTKEACLKHEEELKLKEYLKRYNVDERPMSIIGITDDTRSVTRLSIQVKKKILLNV